MSSWGSLNIEYFTLFFSAYCVFSSPETRVSPWPGKQFFNKECGEWGWLLAWCTSFIFMLLKMERIYQMSKLIVIKWNKYWQKTQTCPVTTNDRNNKYFDDIILFNLHGELLELDLLQNTIWHLTRNLCTYQFLHSGSWEARQINQRFTKTQGKFTETFCSLGML